MPLADRARRIGRPSYAGLNTRAAGRHGAYSAAYGEPVAGGRSVRAGLKLLVEPDGLRRGGSRELVAQGIAQPLI